MSATVADELAEGWVVATLNDVCRVNPPKPPKDTLSPAQLVTFVPMPAVDADSGTIAQPEAREFSAIRNGYTSFKEGDVIFAKITPCMENGKAAIARHLHNGLGFGSTEFHVLRPTDAILPEYVYQFVRQEAFRKAAEADMTGSVGQKRVPADFMKAAEIPLPPLGEQRRIVAKVEELVAGVNTARERQARVPALLKRFRQSVLASACSGRLTAEWRDEPPANGDLPEGWRWTTIGEIASKEPRSIQSGPFGSNLLHSEFQEEGILAIGIDNVLEGKFSLGRQHRISHAKYEELEKYTARPLDILITVMATVGRCCLVPADLETAVITKHVYRITVDQCAASPNYVLAVLRSEAFQQEVEGETIGQTRPGINGRILKGIQLPLPRLAEQREIVRRVDALFALADALEARVRGATTRAERLTQSVLARAFRGELVPTEAELARREGRPIFTIAFDIQDGVRPVGPRARTANGGGWPLHSHQHAHHEAH